MSPLIKHPQQPHIPTQQPEPEPGKKQRKEVIFRHNVNAWTEPDRMVRGLLFFVVILLLLIFLHGHGWAQNIPPARLQVWQPTTTQWINALVDTSGYLYVDCPGCSGGGGGSVTQGTVPWVTQDNADMTGTVPGTAPGFTLIVGEKYNASAPAPTTGQTLPLQSDANGNLKTNCVTGCSGATLPGSTFSGQQAVTATAAALATHTLTSGICVQALSTNTISVFVGPSGVTTSTGQEIPPGAASCVALSNANEIYVVASTTGATVTWLGN